MTRETRIRTAPAWQPPAWVLGELGGATGRGVRVAVVDSGWDRTLHDERVLPGIGFVDPEDDFEKAENDDDHDVLGHGTACAEAVLSVAPDARVIPVKVFGKVLETSPPTIYAAIKWCIQAGVHVINVSLGTRRDDMRDPLYVGCELARRAGIIVVAAGHNGGPEEETYPAMFEPVIGVSAARFRSPYHFRYRPDEAMECEAWGVQRPVLWRGGKRVVRGGTSFAAPNVTGIIALILERHPGATIEQVREMLSRFALSVEKGKAAQAAPSRRPARRRKPAPPPAEAAPGGAAAKPRRSAKAPATAEAAAEPEKKAAKPRKRAAAPAGAADRTTPAGSAAKQTRKRAASAETPPAAADRKPRKRTAPGKSGEKAAPANAGTKPRKAATGPTKAADREAAARPVTRRSKRAQAPAKVVPGDAQPAGEATARRRSTADRPVRAASGSD